MKKRFGPDVFLVFLASLHYTFYISTFIWVLLIYFCIFYFMFNLNLLVDVLKAATQ